MSASQSKSTLRVRDMSVAEFIDRYYKSDRLNNEPGRRDRIIADRQHDLDEHGEALISRHDCVLGDAVILCGGTR